MPYLSQVKAKGMAGSSQAVNEPFIMKTQTQQVFTLLLLLLLLPLYMASGTVIGGNDGGNNV